MQEVTELKHFYYRTTAANAAAAAAAMYNHLYRLATAHASGSV